MLKSKKIKRIISILILTVLVTSVSIPVGSVIVQAAGETLPLIIDFENGKTGGFEPRPDSVKLTVTSEQSQSGKNSLLVSNRKEGWESIKIDIDKYVEVDTPYDITVWARLKSAKTVNIAIYANSSIAFRFLGGSYISNKNWTKIKCRAIFSKKEIESGNLQLVLQCHDDTAEYYIDNFSFEKFNPNRKAKQFKLIDFEDGKTGDIAPAYEANLTVTGEQAHSGKNSLFVTYPKGNWCGIKLNVEEYIEPDIIYDISMWVLIKRENFANISMGLSVGLSPDNIAGGLGSKPVSVSDGWRQLKYRVVFSESDIAIGNIVIDLVDMNCQAEYYIDDFSFVRSEVNENIAAAARLPSIQESHKNDFLISSDLSSDFPAMNKAYFEINKRHFGLVYLNQIAIPMQPDEKGKFFVGGQYIKGFRYQDEALNNLLKAGVKVCADVLILSLSSDNNLPAKKPDGTLINRSEAKAILEANINEIAGHFAGKIYSWGIIGENLFNYNYNKVYDGDWRGAIPGGNEFWNPWRTAYANGADKSKGESDTDFIYDAYVFARLADPKAKLACGDNIGDNVRDFINIDMIKELNEKWKTDPRNTEPERLLIEIVGGWCGGENIELVINRFIPLGAKLNIFVGDIWRPDLVSFNDWQNVLNIYPDFYAEQAKLFAKNFLLVKKYSKYIDNITFNIYDFTNWIGYGSGGIFDDDFKPSLVYFAVIDPEGYLAGNYDTKEKREAWIKANGLKVGDKIGDVLYSDITAYINDKAIPTSVIKGKTLVAVEDLAKYCFDVVWNGTDKTLKVELNKNKKIEPLPVKKDTVNKPGTFKQKYLYTDIKTYLSGKLVESFAIDGRTLIDFELLGKYGKLIWNGHTKEIRLTVE